MAASDTGTLELERVAAERRRLEAEAEKAARDAEVEHPAVVAQRIVDEVLRKAEVGVELDEHTTTEAPDPSDPGTIARRIVEDVLRDQDAIDRAVAAAAEVTASREADAAAAEIRDADVAAPEDSAVTDTDTDTRTDVDDEPAAVPLERRQTDLVYLVLPGEDSRRLVLIPGGGTDPDTRPYIPQLRPAGDTDGFEVRGGDGAALIDRALAPLVRGEPTEAPARARTTTDAPGTTSERVPQRPGLTQNVAWMALAGMWLVAMAALVPLLFQSFVRSVDATPPDFWDDSAVVEDGAPALDQQNQADPEELLDG